jgi:hypothetical protein
MNVLLTVKAYPEKSKRYGSVVCTAGIMENGEFVRLYPVPFENFRGGKNIPKYSWINVECKKASEYLNRKESYKVRYSTLKIINHVDTGVDKQWKERNQIILPLLSDSIEELERKSKIDNTSLGLVKPREIVDLSIDEREEADSEEKKIVEGIQMTLDGQTRTDLEKINYNFRYHFFCNGQNCKGHNMMCEDWEMIESWRRWLKRYGNKETAINEFKKKYLDYMLTRDIHFFVGTHSKFNTWLIIGLYYPPLTG